LPQSSEIAWPITVATLAGLGRIPHQGPFGPSRADQAAVERALAATGMSDFAGRTATSLSGGERARALIARALAGEPDWLLADEPLTGLDPGHALDALRLFRTEAAKGKGVVLTLHDLTLAARAADRIVVLCGGAVIADGAPLQALTPQVLAKAYGVRAEVTETADGPRVDVLDRV
jgi:iron complex transport system ATP-binding protein